MAWWPSPILGKKLDRNSEWARWLFALVLMNEKNVPAPIGRPPSRRNQPSSCSSFSLLFKKRKKTKTEERKEKKVKHNQKRKWWVSAKQRKNVGITRPRKKKKKRNSRKVKILPRKTERNYSNRRLLYSQKIIREDEEKVENCSVWCHGTKRRFELKNWKKKEGKLFFFSLNLEYSRRSGTLDGIHAESSFRPWPSSGDRQGRRP